MYSQRLEGPTLRVAFVGKDITDYGDQFLLRQAESVPQGTVVILRPGSPQQHPDVMSVANRSRAARSIDYRLTAFARRFALDLGPGLGPSTRLRRIFSKVDLVYCLFANDAIQLMPVLIRMPSAPPLLVNCAGGDVTQARHRGQAYLERLTRLFQLAAAVNAGSDFIRSLAIELGAPAERTRTHYLGVDVPSMETPLKQHSVAAPAGMIACLAVARLEAVKGPLATLESFCRVFGPGDQASLTVVGEGSLFGAMHARIGELGRQHQVRMAGKMDRREVFQLMSTSDIFLQHNVRTSSGHEEAIGGSILEASARGLPIVATDSGGVREAVLDGQTGLLARPGDVAAMAGHIRTLAHAPELRAQLGAAGADHVRTHHNAENQVMKLGEQIKGLVEAHRSRQTRSQT